MFGGELAERLVGLLVKLPHHLLDAIPPSAEDRVLVEDVVAGHSWKKCRSRSVISTRTAKQGAVTLDTTRLFTVKKKQHLQKSNK